MGHFDAVLFDFGHTLFEHATPATLCAAFAEQGLVLDESSFVEVWEAIHLESRSALELAKGRDLSAALHRSCWLTLFEPLDDLALGLADLAYRSICDPFGWVPFPESEEVLRALRTAGISTAVVSDCGSDIRSIFRHHGLDALVDHFVLSFEHGMAKPDPRMFRLACEALGTEPARTLMVGDKAATDGGARGRGTTSLVPPPVGRLPGALRAVLALV